ncbi:NUDIX domain-containing protein [Sinorhizobium alkalisoli]|uniref:NUDIX domain-containing protein n=1 Tax=Sinorhizobium alkalisoli TaxID=1752398 RepID=UPI00124DAF1B|nr:NUDIX domain-containing protein [Sinorhizobium alkalisoli]MCG5478075.1 NUDIX domain-containing protein [Sinorhizobium alkalisoli]QFI65687.1 Nudix hydrolase family protein YffH [Sinorhizobium alkalisoli]
MKEHSDSRVRIIDRRPLWNGFISLEQVTLEQQMSDGTTARLVREVHDHGRAATILLFDPERQVVVLVRQLRIPVFMQGESAYLIETPAGLLDGEEPEVAICREAMEETGYCIESAMHLFDAYMSPGSITERTSFFLGRIDTSRKVAAGGGLAHEGEDIEVLEVPFEEAVRMIGSGEICDAKTIMLLQWAMLNGAALSE